jgi:hypothetical protein
MGFSRRHMGGAAVTERTLFEDPLFEDPGRPRFVSAAPYKNSAAAYTHAILDDDVALSQTVDAQCAARAH